MIVGRTRRDVRVPGQADLVAETDLRAKEINMPKDSLRGLDDTGAARVMISMEMKDNDYGRGFGAFASVSLACRQDEDTVGRAYAEATALAAEFVQEAFGIAGERYQATRMK